MRKRKFHEISSSILWFKKKKTLLSTWIIYQENKVGEPFFFSSPFVSLLFFFRELLTFVSSQPSSHFILLLTFLITFSWSHLKKIPQHKKICVLSSHHFSECSLNILIVATVFNLKVKLEKKVLSHGAKIHFSNTMC